MVTKGQGSSLLLCVLSLPLFICQTLEIVILISLLMVHEKEIGTALDLCYHPYYHCLYAFCVM